MNADTQKDLRLSQQDTLEQGIYMPMPSLTYKLRVYPRLDTVVYWRHLEGASHDSFGLTMTASPYATPTTSDT